METEALRREKKAYRASLTKEERSQKSDEIAKKLAEKLTPYANILCFYPLPDEVSLLSLYETFLKEKKALYFPVTKNENLTFYRIESLTDFSEGVFHVMEPIDRQHSYDTNDESTAAIVPGLVFDRDGHRIGYGRGYYDRFLASHPKIKTFGVCFSGQLTEALIPKPHDVTMHEVIFA